MAICDGIYIYILHIFITLLAARRIIIRHQQILHVPLSNHNGGMMIFLLLSTDLFADGCADASQAVMEPLALTKQLI